MSKPPAHGGAEKKKKKRSAQVVIVWTPDYGYGGGGYLKTVACLVPLCSLNCISLWAILNKEESEEENRFSWALLTLTDAVNCGFVKLF